MENEIFGNWSSVQKKNRNNEIFLLIDVAATDTFIYFNIEHIFYCKIKDFL